MCNGTGCNGTGCIDTVILWYRVHSEFMIEFVGTSFLEWVPINEGSFEYRMMYKIASIFHSFPNQLMITR